MIEIVDDDGSWPIAFEKAAARLGEIGEGQWLIEHIGSTSVPGLSAEPVSIVVSGSRRSRSWPIGPSS